MPFKPQTVRNRLKDFRFRDLFVDELGWDKPGPGVTITDAGREYVFAPVAQKRGLQVFACDTPAGDPFPDYPTRLKLDRQLAKIAHEHLVIFTHARARQVWLWVKREGGQPPRPREAEYRAGESGERLVQKLEHLVFTLDEEEQIALADARERTRRAFDVERVTKRFFDRFQKEHAAFRDFIEGLADAADRGWYASLTLNRLMFVYFIQKKGFLDGDTDYLRAKLKEVQAVKGPDQFATFYRRFLLRLFHEGLGKKKADRAADLDRLLGDVPYLNGGLFDPHELEAAHPDIHVPDAAFEALFTFFDAYTWHLDDRPLRRDDEINPDVLGYIFEKYINQKQMGAYYTKEDITGYITRNALLPFVLTKAAGLCEVAFQPGGAVWGLLRDDPDRYIYESVRKGVDLPLPSDIAAGVADVAARGGWNRPAADGYALPTETWREHVARRQRCQELRRKLAAGEVAAVNDLVTLNLDIVRFTTDVVVGCEGPDLLRAVWQTLQSVSVLDPTCGSGAFLFAALNLLDPLYDACLDRMQLFVDYADPVTAAKLGDFKAVLKEVARHPGRRYFVLKQVVVKNLYGVDLMPEAVEICKLRLFLKLVAQVESAGQLEPLPDIDFNVRAGNTLVGFATRADLRAARNLDNTLDLDGIEQEAEDVERLCRVFRDFQMDWKEGQLALTFTKPQLQARLGKLRDRLDRYLAAAYRIPDGDDEAFAAWRAGHQPFHWFVEFHGIMAAGGFDVIVGNPPWIEYAKVRGTYTVQGYATEPCGNLHGICTERAVGLTVSHGRVSFIVQLPLVSSSRMKSVRQLLTATNSALWAIPFDDRPGKLFDGLQNCRSVIFLAERGETIAEDAKRLATTAYQRWPMASRDVLFTQLELVPLTRRSIYPDQFPKVSTLLHRSTLDKLGRTTGTVGDILSSRTTKHFVFYQEATRYWVKVTVGLPYYAKNGVVGAPAHGRYLFFADDATTHAIAAVLNSSLFYLYFITFGDCFHLSDGLATGFPLARKAATDPRLAAHGKALMTDLGANAVKATINTRGGDRIEYDEFYASKSKPIIDEIDGVLAEHYGFTAEELDFLRNYDIKYRLGAEAAEPDAD